MKEMIYVAVLAHGEAPAVSHSTRLRIERAITRIAEIEEVGMYIPVLVLMAGVGCRESTLTLATRMLLCAREYLEKCNDSVRDVRVMVNYEERSIWGTVMEMGWVYRIVHAQSLFAKIEFVTNGRHATRVRWVDCLLYRKSSKTILSNDAPPSLFHEVLAYFKVLAYIVKCHMPTEYARRNFYSGG